MPRFPFVSRSYLAPAVLALLPLFVATAIPAQAAPNADMLAAVPAINEHVINDVACGQAAATMVLDYYLPLFGARPSSVGIATVARYVKFSYRGGSPTGTSPTNLARGLEEAGAALGAPLAATWERSDAAGWQTTLRQQLAAGDPVVVYLADGGLLWGGRWHYAHYIVVSGLTAGGDVIYHDPFDGREHMVSAATFASVWGHGARRTWSYLRITPVGTSASLG
jgi:hypothetical protein